MPAATVASRPISARDRPSRRTTVRDRCDMAATRVWHRARRTVAARLRRRLGLGQAVSVEHQPAPGLQSVERPPRPPSVVANAPVSLSVSRIATGRPAASADEHDPDVDRADRRRVVVEQADGRELRHEVRDELLGPLPAEPAGDVAVARVEVAADADRPQVVQPRVAAGSRPAHQEPALAVAQDQVRDHLLVGAVLLGDRPIHEHARRAPRPRAPRRTPSRRTPVQPGAGTMASRGTTRTRSPATPTFRPRPRPCRARTPAAGGSRPRPAPPSPSRSASQPSITARTSRSRAAISAALVAAIPAPISTSPRASRVMLAQPPAARAAAAGQSGRGSPIGPATASTSAADSDQRQVADRGHAPVVLVGRHPHDPRAAGGGQRLDTRSSAVRVARPRGSTITQGRSRNNVAVGGLEAARLAPGHRVAADEPQARARRRARRSRPSCSRRP